MGRARVLMDAACGASSVPPGDRQNIYRRPATVYHTKAVKYVAIEGVGSVKRNKEGQKLNTTPCEGRGQADTKHAKRRTMSNEI
jgi:hypothetical protein